MNESTGCQGGFLRKVYALHSPFHLPKDRYNPAQGIRPSVVFKLRSPFQYRQQKSAAAGGSQVEKLLRCHLNSRDGVIFSSEAGRRPSKISAEKVNSSAIKHPRVSERPGNVDNLNCRAL